MIQSEVRNPPSSVGPGSTNFPLYKGYPRASGSSVINYGQLASLGPKQLIHECVEKERRVGRVCVEWGDLGGR